MAPLPMVNTAEMKARSDQIKMRNNNFSVDNIHCPTCNIEVSTDVVYETSNY